MRLISSHARLRFLLVLVGSMALGASQTRTSPAAEIPKPEETWQVIYLSGQRVGYARILIEPVARTDGTRLRTQAETHLTIKRFGQELRMSSELESEETLEGDLLRFRFAMKNPPASSSVTSGEVQGTELLITSEVNGKSRQSRQPWKADVKSPLYQERLMQTSPLKAGEKKEFEVFQPEMNRVSKMTITAGDLEDVKLLGNSTSRLQKLTVTNSLLPGVPTKAWVNEKGDSIKSSTSMLGTEMVTYTVSREEALKSLSVAELDLGVSTLVKTKAIPNPHRSKKVVYRVRIPDEDASAAIPSGSTQMVTPVSRDVVDVTVTAIPLPATATVEDLGAEFTGPTPFLQSDDAGVRDHASRAKGNLADPAQIARSMEAYVHKNLAKKNFSTALASAGEVARNLEGDCTEHAVLLAAMLRSAGIPSRVAVGLVYVDGVSAFGGHMWTEAHMNGQWIPLDATLGQGGIGAAHLKLADATFANSDSAPVAAFTSLITILGKLEIEVRDVTP